MIRYSVKINVFYDAFNCYSMHAKYYNIYIYILKDIYQ